MTVQQIFGAFIYTGTVNVPDVDFESLAWQANYSNSITESQRVLDDLPKLKDQCQQHVSTVWRETLCASVSAELTISTSWFNRTQQGQGHHRHWHTNSLVSAVVYFSDQPAAITFVNDRYPQIEYDQHSAPAWNSATWRIEPCRGDILIFPSWLQHQVETVNSTTARYTLSFNTWPSGIIKQDSYSYLSV